MSPIGASGHQAPGWSLAVFSVLVQRTKPPGVGWQQALLLAFLGGQSL